jgi:hypothetical protein
MARAAQPKQIRRVAFFLEFWAVDVCGLMWIGKSFFGGVMVRESLLTMGGKIAGQFSTFTPLIY